MGFEYNDREERQKFLNQLIKSPKQALPLVTRSIVKDCLQAAPYQHIDGQVDELVFTDVCFCSDFSIISIADNKLILIEDCIFHGSVNIHCLKNVKVIIRNCRFRQEPVIKTGGQNMVEIYGTKSKPHTATSLTPDTSFASVIILQDTIILN